MRLMHVPFRFLLAWVAGLLVSSLACAQSTSIVGILEGGATLIRHTTRYTLAEGVVLNEQDIVETAPGAFAQIELPGGTLVAMGESTRLMFRPHAAKGSTAPALYLLQGWLKTSSGGTFSYASPVFDVATESAGTVVHVAGAQYEVFVESGSAKLTSRDAARAVMQLASGDFVQRREGTTPTGARRAPAEFLDKVPRQFRDRLPARREKFAGRSVAPQPLGEIGYTDVSAWLRTEPAMRLPLLPLWRERTSDPAFRAAAKASLSEHPEWEPYADPEGHARRMAQEAERRRAREAARQVTRQPAAPRAASGAGDGGTKPE